MSDCVIRSRIDPLIKAKAMKIFNHMGLTLSEAVRLFLYQSVTEKRIPFSINIPNATTRATLDAIEQGKDLEETHVKKLTDDWNRVCEK